MKTLLIHLFTLFMIFSCTNNATLFDPATSSSNDSQDIGTTSPIVCEQSCIHKEAANYSTEVTSNEPGACDFTACMKEGFAEYEKVYEYRAYRDLYGGTVTHDISKCITKLEYGEGCSHPDASNFVITSSDNPTACYFTGCSDPNFAEYWDYLGMKSYTDNIAGSTIEADNENKCLTRIRGCNSTSPFVTNGNVGALYDDGTCSFKGCSDQKYNNYNADLIADLNAYRASFTGCIKHTGTVERDCIGRLGCTAPNASNYLEVAEIEDGSCSFSCCSTYGASNYDQNCISYVDSYLTGLGSTNPTGTINKLECGKMLGCALNHPYVSNTLTNSQEDGSCDITCCAQEGALNYNSNCQPVISDYTKSLTDAGLTPTGKFINDACQFPGPGCYFQSPYVSNYQPKTVEDGSCDIACCADPTRENYDPKCDEAMKQYDRILSNSGLTYTGVKNPSLNCGKVKGCNFENQFVKNYDSESVENGSCDIECCSDPTRVGYSKDCISAKDTYISRLRSEGKKPIGTLNINKCGPKYGCNYEGSPKPEYVKNYDPDAQENGTCVIQCCGQKGTERYDPTCQKIINSYTLTTKPGMGNINNNFSCGSKLDCNYNGFGVQNSTQGTSENGSCIIECCAQEGFENYSPSCEKSIEAYKDILSKIGLLPSVIPKTNVNCGMKKGCTLVGASNFDADAKLDDGSCSFACRKCDAGYELGTDQECIDKWNDYKSSLATQGIAFDGTFSFTTNCGMTKGCNYNDTRVTNYNSMSVEDGSCKIECCSLEGHQYYDDKCLATVDAYNSSLPAGITGTGTHNTQNNCGQKVGCTYNQYVTNPTPGATVEDGSCDIACCSDPGKENYQAGCEAAVDGYENMLGSITPTGTINENASCGKEKGCNYNNPLVDNYVEGTSENGSCKIECCSLPGYENYKASCLSAVNGYLAALIKFGLTPTAVDGKYNCGRKLGCSVPDLKDASGQPGDPNNLEDGSCIVRCCGDVEKENYSEQCSPKAISYITLLNKMNLNAINQPDQDYLCGRKLGCSFSMAGSAVQNPSYGSKEDGSCDIKCCGVMGEANYSSSCNVYISEYKKLLNKLGLAQSGELDSSFNCGGVTGCMEPLALNYDANATADPYKVCFFRACTNSNYENFANDQAIVNAFNAYGGGQLFSGPCGKLSCEDGRTSTGCGTANCEEICVCEAGTIECHGQCVTTCPAGYVQSTNSYGKPECVCAPGTYQSANGLTCE